MKWPCSESEDVGIAGMLSNGDTSAAAHSASDLTRQASSRSQDDAAVTYLFQRPQVHADFQPFSAKHPKWPHADETPVNIAPSAKKLWGVEDQKDESKVLFNLSDQTWRDSTWSASTIDHAVTQPIGMGPRRSGSFPGSEVANVLSPRSSETGGLGVKMVEYVLGTSPTSKDLESRMRGLVLGPSQDKEKEKTQSPLPLNDMDASVQATQMILSNGLTDEDKSFSRIPGSGSRQPSPAEQDLTKTHSPAMVSIPMKPDDLVMTQGTSSMVSALTGPMVSNVGLANGIVSNLGTTLVNGAGSAGFGLSSSSSGAMGDPHISSSHFQQVMVEPPGVSFDTNYSMLGNPVPEAGDSSLMHTSFDVQQILRAQQQHQVQQQQQHQHQQQQAPQQMLLAQQQFLAQQQQLGLGGTGGGPAFPGAPYVIGPQEPYMGAVIAGPTPMMPHYYGMTPWGMYPAGMLPPGPAPQPPQRRPLSPGSSDQHTAPPPVPQGQYQVIPAYYDQNGSLVMRGVANGAPVRLVSPAPMTVLNPATRQMGAQQPTASLYNAGQQQSLYSGAIGSQAAAATAAPPPTNSLGSLPNMQPGTGLGTSFGTLGLQQNNGLGFNGGGALGSLGSSSLGLSVAMGGRRDSFDRNSSSVFPSLDFNRSKWAQSYGALGTVTTAGPLGLAQSGSLTPPPIGGASSCLQMGIGPFVSGGRVLSAAPGSEVTKFRSAAVGGGLFGDGGVASNGSLFSKIGGVRQNGVLSADKLSGRSRLLDDFRNNRFPSLQLRDITNHIVEFSQDQHGSRFIQQKLERATPAEKQLVFNEICVASYALMTDVFGNYVIQKFFEFGTPEQKIALAQKIRGNVLPLALQMYGCRVIQKALESVGPEMQKEIVHELDGHVLKCVKDQNGNHVVQKCIECVDPRELQFLIDAFEGQVLTLSTHPYGCRVIQRILEHCTAEQTIPVLNELHQHTESLIQDQYGNYVIQHVLEHGNPEDKARIVSSVRGKVLQLSQHKFASNVVEKCITHATRAERAMLIEEVIGLNDNSQHSPLHTMMKDQYANYVVQKMIDVSEPSQRKLLMHKIRPHVNTLRKYTYGKHILAKLEKYFLKNNVDLGPIGPPPPTGGL